MFSWAGAECTEVPGASGLGHVCCRKVLITGVMAVCVWPRAKLQGWELVCLMNRETKDCPLLCI